MARCPAGHESEASDYCDTCGLVIGSGATGSGPVSATSAAAATTTVAPLPTAAPAGASGGARCPVCEAERNGRFCEECGYDFDLAEAMPQVTVTPGVGPATPDPLARTLTEPIPEPTAELPVEPAAEAGGGFDLDAELARAEAAAAEAVSASSPAPGPGPAPVVEAEPASSPAAPSAENELEQPLAPLRASSFSAELALVVDADRGYYDAQVERGDIIESEFPYPKYPHERRFTFTEGPVRIGRASSSRDRKSVV